MPNVLIRDVPDDVHARLLQRAHQTGQSLQQYLVLQLAEVAGRPTMEDVLAQLDAHRGGTVGFDRAVSDLHDERSRV